jgi:hypothetical protein
VKKRGLVEDLEKYVKTTCLSLFDGCACQLPKGHEGLHRCDQVDCREDPGWCDFMSKEWLKATASSTRP